MNNSLEEIYKWWVEGSGKNTLTHAFLIHSLEPLESDNLCVVLNTLNAGNNITDFVPEEVVKTYYALEKEVRSKIKGEDKYDYRVYENGKVDGGVTYFDPSVLEAICNRIKLSLPDHYLTHRQIWKEHNQRLFDDPIYRMNNEAMRGGDISPAILRDDMGWSISLARQIIYGEGNQEDRDYLWFLEKKAYWEGAVEHVGYHVLDYIDAFYRIVIKGGYAQDFKVYNLSSASSPQDWIIDPNSFIFWCSGKDIFLREQIRKLFKLLKQPDPTPTKIENPLKFSLAYGESVSERDERWRDIEAPKIASELIDEGIPSRKLTKLHVAEEIKQRENFPSEVNTIVRAIRKTW